ncbi:hypothetical protein [Stigmatella aurantiaca]|uniref:Branched-chain amino acid ABC transporter, amino acid-binding protein n=1 Tax=Stigmatella aurantiaca (strain DW4/3-1) TaxID=378806 RepID=Q099A1_STIAD|nr:uncharacterized protein STAUR_7690 [Stigmatella aurantiaca DW4/3-1]EAU68274.1 branched-chain amino acid ABC transporter, amino acid-binding protein [Stigmatella aurantiaca DW4/3-1]
MLKAFIEKYQKAYGSVPDTVAALAYDATLVAVDAMKRAPDTSARRCGMPSPRRRTSRAWPARSPSTPSAMRRNVAP